MDPFSPDPLGAPFRLFGPSHLVALGVLVGLNVVLWSLRHASDRIRRAVSWTMALTLWANEIGFHVWRIAVGTWNVQEMVPLHVCSVLAWTVPIALITRNRRLYEFVYFLGLGAASQGVLTPDLGPYDFPHYRYFETFISHGLEFTAALWLTWTGLRPTWRSVWRVFGWLNAYMVVVFFANLALGSNYMFVNRKPATASILDVLPPWPWYVLVLEGIGLVLFTLSYLPFAIADARGRAAAGRPEPAAATPD